MHYQQIVVHVILSGPSSSPGPAPVGLKREIGNVELEMKCHIFDAMAESDVINFSISQLMCGYLVLAS